MRSASPTVVWFRNDLRLADNPALLHALERGPVAPIYVLDEDGPARKRGGASRWWLDKSLRALGEDLAAKGGALVLRRGDSAKTLAEVAAACGAERVVWNRLYDAGSIAQDAAVREALTAAGVGCESFNAGLLNEPDAVVTPNGGYKVFTAYWKAAAPRVHAEPSPAPARITVPDKLPPSEPLESWGLHPDHPDWSTGFADWRPGETGACDRLTAFLKGAAAHYGTGRNLMAEEGVSRLSPHLHFGEIGPRQVWAAVDRAVERDRLPRGQGEIYQRELGWREFNTALLFHHPDLVTKALNPKFDALPWVKDERGFRAWSRGETGYPVVDAAMRQLWRSGWMHNRARMITASFLIKDLLIDWRRGEAWFWDTLVDADLANNVGNWQWVAGSGADAAPFFRIFNPVLQGEKFDPRGAYVRRWVPELAGLPDRFIHQPWKCTPAELRASGVRLGETYPEPIVDHARARERALAAYASLK